MTDSSTGNKSGDGEFDAGPSIDELFREVATEPLEEEAVDRHAGSTGEDDGIEDRTAADVFNQLRNEADTDGGADDVLDESPEAIIASADQPESDTTSADDADFLADEGALEDLLLTGRTKEDEFLWVDSGDSSERGEQDEESEESEGAEQGEESEGAEQGEESEGREQGEASEQGEGSVRGHDAETERASDALEPESDASADGSLESPAAEGPDPMFSFTERPAATVGESARPTKSVAASDGPNSTGSAPTDEADDEGATAAPSTDPVDDSTSVDDREEDTSPDDREENTTLGDLESAAEASSLVLQTDEQLPATTEEDDSGSGFLAWLRSKLPF